MIRFCVAFAGLLVLPAAGVADGESSGCGGDSYSFAEVVSSPSRGEPIIAVPDTLCADLSSGQGTRIESLSIYLDRRSDGAGRQPDIRPSQWPAAPHPRH